MIPDDRIRIILADDHPLVLEGIRACLEIIDCIEIVGVARDGGEALKMAHELTPDMVVLDINMPGLNGLDAIELFQEQLPDIKILILSMHNNKEYISTALKNGARGYVLKDVPTKEVVAAIQAIHSGGTYISSGVSDVLMSACESDAAAGPLTTREQTVLLILAEGMSNKEVACKLDISIRTVETHRRNIKRKLGISSTAGLVRYAINNGLVSESDM
jgi:two-component system nitrate/nitrite response regulator NarL